MHFTMIMILLIRTYTDDFCFSKPTYSSWCMAVSKVGGHNIDGFWAKTESASEDKAFAKSCPYLK